jgi:hypothetical protein
MATSSTSRFVCSCALLCGVALACGARTGLPDPPLGCKETAEPVVQKVPNLYFVLDRSTSMSEPSFAGMKKWTVVRNDIAQLMVSLGDKAQFGAAVFPPPLSEPSPTVQELCEAGQQVMPLRLGDGLPIGTPGSTAGAFWNATLAAPLGGTPTAATLLALKDELAGFPGHTFAILATDGGPNCNTSLTCGVTMCTLNIDNAIPGCTANGTNCCAPDGWGGAHEQPWDCLDGTNAVAAAGTLAEGGVPTFVIGVPGSEAYANVLDRIAQAGGTARSSEPYYYPVSGDPMTLVDALTNIAARITVCTLELKNNPPDPGQVNVIIDKVPVLPGPGGWSLDGNIVTLNGATCDEAVSGAKVTITFGCTTVD